MDIKRPYVLLWWRVQPLAGYLLGGAIAVALGALIVWLQFVYPPPGEAIDVPHQWSCYSKYEGGYCQRTGGVDRNGRPWGTAVPKWYTGPPTKADAARMAMTSGD